jgi:hypothetical protein
MYKSGMILSARRHPEEYLTEDDESPYNIKFYLKLLVEVAGEKRESSVANTT